MRRIDNVKISVIVPVYHTEHLLEDCIKSIVEQTWTNMEVIVVDDGSDNGADKIIESFADDRLIMVKHTENRGLFRARVTGMQHATGDYIVFVDSDDTLGVDFLRLLVEKAVNKSADVVVGNTVFVEESGVKKVSCLHKAAFFTTKLSGDAVRNSYFEQEGRCHSWHNVWNKLYARSIIDACLADLDKFSEHLIMGEDILFSSLFLFHAQQLETEPNANYFYYRRNESSVGENTKAYNKFIKNLHDLKNVFDFVDEYLKKQNAGLEIQEHFWKFRCRYGKIWSDLSAVWKEEEDYYLIERELNNFCDSIPEQLDDSTYFGLFEREWGDGVETVKKGIMSEKYQYISFDIFDTAVVRPFGKPEDLFGLLNKEFEKHINCNISFQKIRVEAEQGARRQLAESGEKREDITLKEIYDYIGANYLIPEDVCKRMMQEEMKLEVQFASARATIKEFYDVAIAVGKKVIFVSDMYLPEECIRELLEKCGYKDYEKVFVSAEYGVLKQTGKLYDEVLAELQIDAIQMLHIGDNEVSDIQCALEKGIDAFFVPKAWDMFLNEGYRYPTGNRTNAFKDACGVLVSKDKVMDNCAIRSMMALAAKKMFDNPFVCYDSTSNFDYNPYLIGYFAVGTHLLGASKWILDTAKEKKYGRIIYTSRDGWLYMQAHKIWQKYCDSLPDTKYIYVSRQALLPAMILKEADLYNLPIEVTQYTPQMLFELLAFCTDTAKEEEFWNTLTVKGLERNTRFLDNCGYNLFIKCFIETAYSEEVRLEHLLEIKEYMSFLRTQDAIFDMGYSGRIHKAIVDVTEKNVDALFIHKDTTHFANNARKGSFEIHEFLNLNPLMPDLLREHMISHSGKTCIGYERVNGSVVPKLEGLEKEYCDKFVLAKLHQGALDFVEDFLKYFYDYLDYVSINPKETALALEGFLASSAVGDRNIFICSYFEDKVYSGNPHNNVAEYINEQHRIMSLIKCQ